MTASQRRHDLLRARLRGFTRALPQPIEGDLKPTDRAWTASRRLRELLPILQLDGPTVEKLTARLRRLTRKLGDVRRSDALLGLLDELDEADRRGRQARSHVRDELQRQASRARKAIGRRKSANDVRRIAEKLTRLVQTLAKEPDTPTQGRAMDWAAKARVARRAADLRDAIHAAGSVYLPGRLDAVRTAARKLRFGAELESGISGSVPTGDTRLLTRLHVLLEQLDDAQALIGKTRQVQSSLATPDLKAWRDLDGLMLALENRCRSLHARYVRERPALLVLCDRLVARAPADGSAKRKVG